ncbi:diaminobutyrate aminotransferase [Natrinema hispanicum]|uniref:Diaminobutyrate aminotransferase n=1 Tax=Natrinema hispanicum TaxID=392421 RepID=A0A482Y7K7_9EURY|nr:aspartate aminotransferase family protein [Natrinema hispanicum]RZV06175.1 diaminobutyrate aminotransferase [Natrinema hispanicum]
MAIEQTFDDLHFTQEPEIETSIPGPESKKLLERQRHIDSSAVAYPKVVPIAIEEAKGATIRDVDGNTFLDFFAGIGVLNVGHSNPYVMEAVQEQTEKVAHTIDFPTEARLDLIEALNDIAPGALPDNNRVIFGGPTGSDAIEGTIKLAKYNTGGDGLIAFRGAYHGGSAGALSLTAGKKYKEDYAPMLPNVHHVPYPFAHEQGLDPQEASDRALANVRELLEDPYSGFANPAGIWVEPIQGEGGIVTPPEGFLPGLKEIAENNDIPLIVDEIQTGFGRTGEWFASDHYDVTPDAMPMAKAIGGIGLPLSGTMYHEDLDTWEAGGHVGTYRGNAPAMVGGVRAIEYIRDNDLLAHAREVGSYIRDRLRESAGVNERLVDVRGRGLFIGAEFADSEDQTGKELVKDIQEDCYKRGVLVWSAGRHGNVLRLIPPLVLTQEQATAGMDIICDAIERHAPSSNN